MLQTNIVFLDIPTTFGVPVSPYTWRVRLYLNFRGFQYTTLWVSTVDIEAECISWKISPTGTKPSGEPMYTLPAILDYTSATEPTPVSDSFRILRYLEHEYPSESHAIFPREFDSQWTTFNKFVNEELIMLGGLLFLRELARSKVPRDLGPFKARMELMFGAKWNNLGFQGLARDDAWRKMESNLSSLLKLFESNKGGCFLIRDTPSYPDFVISALLMWSKKMVSDDEWATILAWDDGRWRRSIQLFDSWTFVDGHPEI